MENKAVFRSQNSRVGAGLPRPYRIHESESNDRPFFWILSSLLGKCLKIAENKIFNPKSKI